jgi:hypothetical protein
MILEQNWLDECLQIRYNIRKYEERRQKAKIERRPRLCGLIAALLPRLSYGFRFTQ